MTSSALGKTFNHQGTHVHQNTDIHIGTVVCPYTAVVGMPLEQRLGTDLRRVHQELMAVKHDAVKAAAGLTVPQYTALYLLDEAPGISGAALARACLVTPQTMGTVLANLVSAGLVERTQHPWHRNILETRLTPAGRRALKAADQAATTIERRLAAQFTEREIRTLRGLLRRCSSELTTIAADQDTQPASRP
jgi:DNA-binding MarR family transcriptional regulator